MKMYHAGNRIYFGREPSGEVRMLQLTKGTPLPTPGDPGEVEIPQLSPWNVVADIRIPASQWAVIVAAVSQQGHTPPRFYAAQAFHMNPGSPGTPAAAFVTDPSL